MLLSGSQGCGSTLASAQQLRCSIRNTSRTALSDALYCNIHLQEQTFLTWTIQMIPVGKWSRLPVCRKWMAHLETSATGTLLYTRFYFMWTHILGQFSLFFPLVLESNSASDPTQCCHWLWGTQSLLVLPSCALLWSLQHLVPRLGTHSGNAAEVTALPWIWQQKEGFQKLLPVLEWWEAAVMSNSLPYLQFW